jgi:uncharacterized membrane protein
MTRIDANTPSPKGGTIPHIQIRAFAVVWMALLLTLVMAPAIRADSRTTGQELEDQEPPTQILLTTARVVLYEREVELLGQLQLIQELELTVLWGPRRGEVLTVEHTVLSSAGQSPLASGDWLYVSETPNADGGTSCYIVGYARWPRLVLMGLIFAALVVVIGRRRGARALAGMGISFVILLFFVLPRMSQGHPPVTTALVGAILTLPFSYLMAHGANRKTAIALVGSAIGLAITAALAVVGTDAAQLSGYASEEASFLQAIHTGAIDVKGLLLAGMIVGILGVLDDVTVTQAGIVEQIQELNPSLSWRELYSRAMRLGQDHIASMVNTLVLVYAGSALPLLLLLSDRSLSPLYVISHEVVAEEVARMLVTSAGLVATVPITTLIAVVTLRGWGLLRRQDGDATP